MRAFIVSAHYFESGNCFEIQRADTFDAALAIAERATAQLTADERKVFNYKVEALSTKHELERVKTQRDIYAAAIRSVFDVAKREGWANAADTIEARLHEAATTVEQYEKRA